MEIEMQRADKNESNAHTEYTAYAFVISITVSYKTLRVVSKGNRPQHRPGGMKHALTHAL